MPDTPTLIFDVTLLAVAGIVAYVLLKDVRGAIIEWRKDRAR